MMGQTTAQAKSTSTTALKHYKYVCNNGKHETKKWACFSYYFNLRVKHVMRFVKESLRPPHYDEWMCIHHYEGSWDDPNSPYYGGLQMDEEFQKTYGMELYRAKGTADHWTPFEQMWVAERAYKTRGFYPWPNTARYCGLI